MNKYNLGRYVNAFTMYQFIQDITKSFNQFTAFRLGIIDDKGNLKKDPETPEEKKAYSTYFQMIINIKKIFNKVPDPTTKSKLRTTIGTINLFSEEMEGLGVDSKQLKKEIYSYLKEQGMDLFLEDINFMFEDIPASAPANSVGAGAFGTTNLDSSTPSSRSSSIAGFDPILKFLRRRKKKKNG